MSRIVLFMVWCEAAEQTSASYLTPTIADSVPFASMTEPPLSNHHGRTLPARGTVWADHLGLSVLKTAWDEATHRAFAITEGHFRIRRVMIQSPLNSFWPTER